VRPPSTAQAGPLGVSLGDLAPDPFWALLAPGSDPLNKVLAFVGTRGRGAPAIVLKMPRTAAAVAPIAHEAAVLQALHSSGAAPTGVPRLLATHSDGEAIRAIAESPLQGRPLSQLLDRRRHPQLVERATEWLIELARVPPQVDERPGRVLDLAEEAAAAAAPGDRELLLAAGRIATPADLLPVVFEQRDFSPWNVHVGRDGGLVVFDWESAEPSGFPALDLVYLLAYCGFFLDRALQSGRLHESYRATFTGRIAAGCLTRYCTAVGIPLDHFPALRALTWLVHVRAALLRDPSGAAAAPLLHLLREELR
jgi:aminoglycoside phosphotransferase (APT) family kinase protein